jgi:microsomal epoxide hydrolase
MQKTLTNGFVESQGIHLHYLANDLSDTQKLSILFVPGVMMPAWIWDRQLDYFSKQYRVVALDTRSQGDSEQTTEGHYAYSLAKDIHTVVETLKLSPLILVGWSLGVPEVVNYAAHFAGKGLKGLVLVDGLVGIDSSLPFYKSTIDYWTQFQVARKEKTEEFVRMIFKQPQSESFYEKLAESAMKTPTNTVMTLIENYLLQDFRSLLPKIQVPTWMATVEGPRLDYMKKTQKLLPHSHLDIIPSAGHALFVDQAPLFNATLETFIEKCVK